MTRRTDDGGGVGWCGRALGWTSGLLGGARRRRPQEGTHCSTMGQEAGSTRSGPWDTLRRGPSTRDAGRSHGDDEPGRGRAAGAAGAAATASTAEHAAAMLRVADRRRAGCGPAPGCARSRSPPRSRSRATPCGRRSGCCRTSGWSTTRLHRGVHVRTVSPDDVRSMYLTRRLVEPLGLDAAAGDPAVLGALRRLVDDAVGAAAAGGLGRPRHGGHRVPPGPDVGVLQPAPVDDVRAAAGRAAAGLPAAAGPPRAARAVRRPQRGGWSPCWRRGPRGGPAPS